MSDPKSTIADVMLALGAKTADLLPLAQEDRIALRLDLDREIAAFHAAGQEHCDPKIAAKYPRAA